MAGHCAPLMSLKITTVKAWVLKLICHCRALGIIRALEQIIEWRGARSHTL